jgi:hypothetical protein
MEGDYLLVTCAVGQDAPQAGILAGGRGLEARQIRGGSSSSVLDILRSRLVSRMVAGTG